MQRLLVVGYGDIARRATSLLAARFTITGLSRRAGFDLDHRAAMALGAADALLHCAPPPPAGERDSRTANLLAALDEQRVVPGRVVYISTSGVYGDCAGERVDETRPINPQTPRARRRADAERQLEQWGTARGTALVILRAPGIYAADRLPLDRLRARLPVLCREEDVYTSHIHADDLAAAVARALEGDAPAGTYNAADDSELLMGDWLDLVADHAGLPRPPRAPASRIAELVPPELLSFMQESRRLDNARLKQVLGVRLRYPTVHQGLRHEHAIGIH
ncbi:MAG TPA: NAD-dependent epimerase/dehydratase family protein [Burkholderiales bacterium]|nr:NAD-dependent epimerase/dehydratase family protein [Burkholderiales bacterium]